jgi:spermidine/putrescine transport system permease protein
MTARPRRPSGDRFAPLVEGGFRVHAALVYAFLFLPIVIVVIFSFNGTTRYVTDWAGFSTIWYQRAFADQTVQNALRSSLFIALINAVLATTFGTMAALGLQRVPRRLRIVFDALTFVSIIIPEIVIALATLVLFSLFRDWANPWLAFFSSDPSHPARVALGPWSVVAAHVLFNLSLVLLIVRARLAGMDRTLVDASYDLYASPWRTFRQVTFPQLLPAIVAGFLLSFTFSFDDYVISSFVSGSTETLPLFVFGQIHQGITPLTNAIAAIMLLVTIAVLLIGQGVLARQSRVRGDRGSTPLGMLEGQSGS